MTDYPLVLGRLERERWLGAGSGEFASSAEALDRVRKPWESVFGVEMRLREPGVGRSGLQDSRIFFGNQFFGSVSHQAGEYETLGGR